jgi:hypothetical protein
MANRWREQLHALAYIALKSHDHGYAISLVFFGCQCIVLVKGVNLAKWKERLGGVSS